MPYLPGLDGMRALAVVAVMIFHANHDWLSGGFLGVEVFFVISGYLITLLLIAEHERAGFVSLSAFWGRRFRRLLPALYLTLVGVAIYCALFLRDPLGKLRGDIVAAVFYVANWFQIWSGQSYSAQNDFVPLRHLWSLAVEEQFYLVWPLVMIVILRAGRHRLPQIGMWLIAGAFVMSAVVAMFFHGGFYTTAIENPGAFSDAFGRKIDTNNFLYLSTITRSGGIMLGAGFAMLWRPLAVNRGAAREKGRALDIAALIGLLGLLLQFVVFELIGSTSGRWYGPLFRGGLLLTGVFTIMIIAAVTHNGSTIGKFLGNKVFNWVGTRSYGLYLFHWPIIQMIRKAAGIGLTVPKFVVAMLLTAVVAELSYRLVEMPVRRRDFMERLRAAGPKAVAGLVLFCMLGGYAIVQTLIADVRCTNTVECANEAAKATNTLPTVPQLTDPTASTIAQETTQTSVGETTTTGAPTTVARQTIDILALGESVMAGATAKLTEGGIVVNAVENQGPNAMRVLLEQYIAGYDITGGVVLQVGTNAPVTTAQYDELMTVLVDAGVPRVWVLTVKAPLDWIAPNNEKINALPAKFPIVEIIDWATFGATIESELSPADGFVHLRTTKGILAYTNLILTSVGKTALPEG